MDTQFTVRDFVSTKYWPIYRKKLCPAWQERSDDLIAFIYDGLGDEILHDLVPEKIEGWWTDLQLRFKTPVTPNKVLARLKHIFETAVRWDYMRKNPARYIRRVKEPNRKFKLLTPEQEQLLISKANPRLRLYILFAMFTGQRRSSIAKLEERDINIHSRTIHFRKTKNGEDYDIPMHPQIEAICERLLTGEPTRRVLPQYEDVRAVSQLFHRLCTRCGIEGFRFHDFRHTVGSKMGEAGANPKAIMAMLGHKDIKMTMRYTHIQLEVVRELTTDMLQRDIQIPALV